MKLASVIPRLERTDATVIHLKSQEDVKKTLAPTRKPSSARTQETVVTYSNSNKYGFRHTKKGDMHYVSVGLLHALINSTIK